MALAAPGPAPAKADSCRQASTDFERPACRLAAARSKSLDGPEPGAQSSPRAFQTSRPTHLFGLLGGRLLLLELALENIAIRLQFRQTIFVLAIEQLQLALEPVLLLFEELPVETAIRLSGRSVSWL